MSNFQHGSLKAVKAQPCKKNINKSKKYIVMSIFISNFLQVYTAALFNLFHQTARLGMGKIVIQDTMRSTNFSDCSRKMNLNQL